MSEPKDPANPFIADDEEMEPLSPEEDRLAQQEIERRAAEADMEMTIIDNVRGDSADPVQPTRLKAEDALCFSCHRGISCWNECCYNTDITLTPFDILRLSRHLSVRPAEFLGEHTVPAIADASGLPIAKLKVKDKEGGQNPCVFLDEEKGCTVYNDRPVSCRYYPLGLAAVKLKGHDAPEDFFFLVKESHCKGHEEPKEQTVQEFRSEQGVEAYDEQNRGWIEILMKLASWKFLGGPWGREPDARAKQMFFMATTDIDAFRQFVFQTKFLEAYEIDADAQAALKSDDELLLKLAFDWLKHILFNEPTIKLRESTMQEAIARAQRDMGAG